MVEEALWSLQWHARVNAAYAERVSRLYSALVRGLNLFNLAATPSALVLVADLIPLGRAATMGAVVAALTATALLAFLDPKRPSEFDLVAKEWVDHLARCKAAWRRWESGANVLLGEVDVLERASATIQQREIAAHLPTWRTLQQRASREVELQEGINRRAEAT